MTEADQHDETPTFVPIEPESFREADLTDSEVEALILKYLLARGDASGRDIADQVKLPFVLVDELLRQDEERPAGRPPRLGADERLPVPADRPRPRAGPALLAALHLLRLGARLADGLHRQRRGPIARPASTRRPTTCSRAFDDLLLNQQMLDRLGPAINSGRGLFLFGPPGNGKTSIAERVTAAFGQYIWIPRAIGIDGEIIRLFDPVNHEEVPLRAERRACSTTRKIDKRWVRIRRPTIVAGGELTMSPLEVTINTVDRHQRGAAAD